MTPQEVIKCVQEKRPHEGWHIYPFNWSWGLLGLAWRVAYVVGFSAGAWILFINREQDELAIPFAILLGVCAAVSAVVFLLHVAALIYGDKNMIVLTEKSAIKSFRGKITDYPYSEIHEMRLVRRHGNNTVPEHYIEFTDGRTGRMIELARNRSFGRADGLFDVLRGRVSLRAPSRLEDKST